MRSRNNARPKLKVELNQVISETQTANKAQARLRELESTAATYHSLYESFLQRYTGAVQQELFSTCRSSTDFSGIGTSNQS